MYTEAVYRQNALSYDHMLTRHGFRRVCDYQRMVCEEDLAVLENTIESATNEKPLQSLLSDRSHLLINTECAQGCRWFKASPRLGSNYVPDFVVARMDSNGLSWTLVELQSPRCNLFIDTAKQGRARPGKQLREGLDQISRWRSWIERRGSVATAAEGYPDLTPHFRGVIFIARSRDKLADLADDRRLKEIAQQHQVVIQSYDSILRAAWEVMHDCGINHQNEDINSRQAKAIRSRHGATSCL